MSIFNYLARRDAARRFRGEVVPMTIPVAQPQLFGRVFGWRAA
jgi:hypothetical protein